MDFDDLMGALVLTVFWLGYALLDVPASFVGPLTRGVAS
jgi:hypothetical protein